LSVTNAAMLQPPYGIAAPQATNNSTRQLNNFFY
jgi:hypothetical protein